MSDKKEVKKVVDTTNPFNKGVSYDDFLKNVKGKVTIDSLLSKHKLSNESKEWIKTELKNHNKNKK